MATTIRQFKTPEDAANFYSGGSNMYNRDEAYNNYLSNFAGAAGPNTSGTMGGGLPGNRTNIGSPSAGYVPVAPNPLESFKDSILGNIGNMQYIKQLYQQLQDMMLNQAMANREQLLPGSTALRGQFMSNIADKAAGRLSQAALDQRQTMAAERGVAMGAPNSPAINSALLRALMLDAQKMQTEALTDYNTLIAGTPTVPQTDVSPALMTGNDYQQWQYLANVLAASPDPAAKQASEYAAAMAGMLQGYGGTNPFRGYFNDGSWLLNTLPQFRSGGSPASTAPLPTSANRPTNTPVAGGYGSLTDEFGNVVGTVGNKPVDWYAYESSPAPLAPDYNEGGFTQYPTTQPIDYTQEWNYPNPVATDMWNQPYDDYQAYDNSTNWFDYMY